MLNRTLRLRPLLKLILLPFTLVMIFLILAFSMLILTPLFFRSLLSLAIKAFTLKSLEIPNQSQIIVGDKKIKGWTGITKGTIISINIINSNPLVSNIDMQTYTIREEKKWYETRGFAAGVGLVGGLILFK